MGTRRISIWIRRRFGSRRAAIRGVDITFLLFLVFVVVTARAGEG